MTATITDEHEHGAAHHQTAIAHQTPKFIAELRKHMWNRHGASAGWARAIAVELLHEIHNREHGRDAHGMEF